MKKISLRILVGMICFFIGSSALANANPTPTQPQKHTGEQSYRDLLHDPDAFPGIACGANRLKEYNVGSNGRPNSNQSNGNAKSVSGR